jgi:hypothetical protein
MFLSINNGTGLVGAIKNVSVPMKAPENVSLTINLKSNTFGMKIAESGTVVTDHQ